MSRHHQLVGCRFLGATQTERLLMAEEYNDQQKQQEIVNEFGFSRGPQYGALEEFKNELAFLVMVSQWFEPRDIASFVWELCYRAKNLSAAAVRDAAASIADLMDPVVQNTHVGECSIRSVILNGIEENLSRRQAG